jgi:hypothetical protein
MQLLFFLEMSCGFHNQQYSSLNMRSFPQSSIAFNMYSNYRPLLVSAYSRLAVLRVYCSCDVEDRWMEFDIYKTEREKFMRGENEYKSL